MTGRTRRRRTLDAATALAFRLPGGRRDYDLTRGVPVAMRDGVELLTDVYAPVGPSRGTLLVRTPYGRTGVISAVTAAAYATHGFRVVNQSCRGTSGSGGWFEPFRHEIDDGADTVAWLRSQPWFEGRFAVCGASYLGYTAWAVLVDPPPELATAVIAATAHDNHWVAHGSGSFSLEQVLSLFDAFGHLVEGPLRTTARALTAGRRLAPGFEQLPLVRAEETVLSGDPMPYRAWLTAPDAADPVWSPQRLSRALEVVDVPVLLQEGWQDRFVDQMLDQYRRLRGRGVDVGLTIGPWTHVELATRGVGPTLRESLDWLGQHLEGRRPSRPGRVRIFVTGAGEWRSLPDWPVETTDRVLYLRPAGGLTEEPPAEIEPPSTFTYDPADPTPAIGGRVVNPAMSGHRDNRQLERRDDVLTFTGPPFDEATEVVGTPVVELAHGTDNPYADVFVRLCEVTATGRSTNLSDGFRRLGPGTANGMITMPLEPLAHRFGRGTRIRLQVSGGAHPRFARHLGTAEDPATGTTTASSRRTIGHGAGGLSRLLLPCPAAPSWAEPDGPSADQELNR